MHKLPTPARKTSRPGPFFSDNGIYFEAHSKSAPASSTTGTPAPESCYYPPVRLLSGTVVSLFTEKCSNGLAKCILGLALRSPSCDYRLAWPDAASIVRPQKQVVARDFAAGSSRQNGRLVEMRTRDHFIRSHLLPLRSRPSELAEP